jgi:hypothetical protein
METLPLQRALGIAAGRPDADLNTPIATVLGETVEPEEIQQPVELTLEGKRPASLMCRRRGFGRDATLDIMVSPELLDLLSPASLPQHTRIDCRAFPPRRRQSVSFTWLWWKETFSARLDPMRSLFQLRSSSGELSQTNYASLEAYEQACLEAVNTLSFSIKPLALAWRDEQTAMLDLIPFDGRIYLSDLLAERLAATELPGVRILE